MTSDQIKAFARQKLAEAENYLRFKELAKKALASAKNRQKMTEILRKKVQNYA